MPLNAEELRRQKQFEKEHKHYSRPTLEQLKVDSLSRELDATRSLNKDLGNMVDRQTKQLDQINGAINEYLTGERSKAITLDTIIQTMGWRR